LKITFPHMGNVYLAAKALFDGLGIDYVIPPLNNKAALEIGALYSPEEICLPFKLMIGNYLQAIEQGADTVVLTGSCGPCRFGEYSELQMQIMKKLGYKLDFIVMDVLKDIGWEEFLSRVKKIAAYSNKPTSQKFKALFLAFRVMNLIDEIEARAHYLAGYEKVRGTCKKLLNSCKAAAINCTAPEEMVELLLSYKKQLDKVELDPHKKPLKIAVIGEIYTIIEPFTNLNIEERLMDYGISTKRRLTPSWWLKNVASFKLNDLLIRKRAEDYLALEIGGHARECVSKAVLAWREGFDGAIQVFPMGCMPEIVSKAILPTISKDKSLPIMTLIVDEMTGEAGYITRLEAFIDLLHHTRNSAAQAVTG